MDRRNRSLSTFMLLTADSKGWLYSVATEYLLPVFRLQICNLAQGYYPQPCDDLPIRSCWVIFHVVCSTLNPAAVPIGVCHYIRSNPA